MVEVLAALTIASLAVVAALALFTQSARVNDRLIKETAARDLVRLLLATGDVGRGQAGDEARAKKKGRPRRSGPDS